MKLTLADAKYLKDSISIISDLVTEGRFKISSNGMELVAMDPANVAMVIFKLLSSTFTEYQVDKEVQMAMNLSNLKQVLRRAKQSDTLTLQLDSDNKLKVILKGHTTRTFSLPIIELEEKDQKVPSLEFSITINTSAGFLSDAIDDVDIVAESVSFIADDKSFTIEAEGDLSKAKIEAKQSDDLQIERKISDKERKISDKVKAKYSIEYLKKMVGGSKISNKVAIHFNMNYPLKLDYLELDKVMLSFILAPRVEND